MICSLYSAELFGIYLLFIDQFMIYQFNSEAVANSSADTPR